MLFHMGYPTFELFLQSTAKIVANLTCKNKSQNLYIEFIYQIKKSIFFNNVVNNEKDDKNNCFCHTLQFISV